MCMMDHQQQQQQEMSSQTLESMLVCAKAEQEKKATRAAEQQQPQKCPRCDSANTKFCYYNNYSLSQPRYFCKSCRRYWTKGGTLRNVPVGGGCRKNRRSSSSAKRSNQDNVSSNNTLTSPISSYDSSTDLSLAFARLQNQTNAHLGINQEHENNNNNNNMSLMYNTGNVSTTTFLDALRGYGFLENAPNHGMYYGNMGQLGEHGDLGMSHDQEMSIGTSNTIMTTTTTATVKQEMARSSEGHDQNNNSNNNGKFSWGFPWQQMNGDHHLNNMNMSDFESTNKQSWNGFGGSSNYFGLLNSPLM